jgi:aspartate/methionine/tyrosine aminotransferase
MDISRLIADRSRAIDTSAVVRMFELGAKLKNPINLSIGQPEFSVPAPIKDAACAAIQGDRNGYTVTHGVPALRERLADSLRADLGWDIDPARRRAGAAGVMVTSGTSGALLAAIMAVADPGDEIIIGDPYFGSYPHLAAAAGARAVYADTYPDFRLTAARVEPLISPRTKAVLFNSPGNPSGVVATREECADLLDLCRCRGVLLISDEIYADLAYDGAADAASGPSPSPGREPGAAEDVLVIRGFGKTYAVTGWRLGYAAGPAALIGAMEQLHQLVYVCPPAPLQWGVVPALDLDVSGVARTYERRAARVYERLSPVARLERPRGAFFAFVELPKRLGMTGEAFFEKCLEKNLLIMPGRIVSRRDTHVRISFAAPDETLEQGLDLLVQLLSA